jgi:hypothetical protein
MSYLDNFTKGVRSAYNFIRMGIAEGLSANKILTTIKAIGLGVRRTEGLKLIREIKQSSKDSSAYLPSDISQKPIGELLPPSYTSQSKRYRWVIQGDVFDPVFEQSYKKHVTVETDFLHTQAEILALGMELMRDTSEDFGTEVGEIRIASIDDSFIPVVF